VSALLAATVPVTVAAQSEISELSSSDPVYRQHQELIAQYHRAGSTGAPLPPPFILTYETRQGETLFEIASRLMLPYSTISTLNRLQDTRLSPGTRLLIPSRPGLFVHANPRTGLEERLFRRFTEDDADGPEDPGAPRGESFRLPDTGSEVIQYDGTDFLPEERRLFLRIVFDDPLPEGTLSSSFGYRHHPITGVWAFHYGIDLAGSFGDSVLAAASGTVTSIERDPWLGLSLTLEHTGDYLTRYAHLQEVFVQEGTFVERGATIGSVGSTGFSTGPHLHFEVLHQGAHENPERYLMRRKR
jgi:murein DD-endopeptidase MepM/ murein hydrolase activator NlpD